MEGDTSGLCSGSAHACKRVLSPRESAAKAYRGGLCVDIRAFIDLNEACCSAQLCKVKDLTLNKRLLISLCKHGALQVRCMMSDIEILGIQRHMGMTTHSAALPNKNNNNCKSCRNKALALALSASLPQSLLHRHNNTPKASAPDVIAHTSHGFKTGNSTPKCWQPARRNRDPVG